MAYGALAKASLSTNAGSLLYTVPSNLYVTLDIICVNTGGASTLVQISILDSNESSPSGNDYIEYNYFLDVAKSMRISDLKLASTESVYIKNGSGSTIAVRIQGRSY